MESRVSNLATRVRRHAITALSLTQCRSPLLGYRAIVNYAIATAN
jgi:hypothetical protein